MVNWIEDALKQRQQTIAQQTDWLRASLNALQAEYRQIQSLLDETAEQTSIRVLGLSDEASAHLERYGIDTIQLLHYHYTTHFVSPEKFILPAMFAERGISEEIRSKLREHGFLIPDPLR